MLILLVLRREMSGDLGQNQGVRSLHGEDSCQVTKRDKLCFRHFQNVLVIPSFQDFQTIAHILQMINV